MKLFKPRKKKDIKALNAEFLSLSLLAWYDLHARDLPWRIHPNDTKNNVKANPYHVWISEIMLQQTTVITVKPYFIKFLKLWPSINDLAAAPLDDVLIQWAGLGYYARARHLHKCAIMVAEEYGGKFPSAEKELLKLPGIGIYTAAAIASIAYDASAVVIDGNVDRVISRMFNIRTPLPDSKNEIRSYAEKLTPSSRAGDYAQAIMDLGATICTPKALKCSGRCPWERGCISASLGTSAELPIKKKKPLKPTRRGYAFWAEYKGYIWLCKREEKGLLGGMMEIPSTDWIPSNSWDNIPEPQVPIIANWKEVHGLVRHTFTHFHLELKIIRLDIEEMINLQEGSWYKLDELDRYALPTVMMKIIHHLQEPVLDL